MKDDDNDDDNDDDHGDDDVDYFDFKEDANGEIMNYNTARIIKNKIKNKNPLIIISRTRTTLNAAKPSAAIDR